MAGNGPGLVGTLCFVVIAILRLSGGFLVEPNDPEPTLTYTTSGANGGRVTLTCRTAQTSSPVTKIDIGRGSSYNPRGTLASIVRGGQSNTVTSDTQVLADGHIDPASSRESYLNVHLSDVDCSTDSSYFCTVTASGTQTTTVDVHLCNRVAVMSLQKDEADPTDFAVTCAISSHVTPLGPALYMQVDRKTFLHGEETLAYANASEPNTNGTARRMTSFVRDDVTVSGQISDGVASRSFVEVGFPVGLCADYGTYSCRIVYTEDGSRETRLALAELTVPNACGTSSCIRASLGTDSDPTNLSVTCSHSSCSDSVLEVELTLKRDHSSDRQLVAYLDYFSTDPVVTVADEYQQRGMTGTLNQQALEVDFHAGTCNDAGVYRCKVVYKASDSGVKVDVDEMTLPACLPGAVATFAMDSGYIQFGCTVNPALVSELVSLEISTISDGRRVHLAFISSYLNGGHPMSYTNHTVRGEIHPHHPTRSYLAVRYDSGGQATFSPHSVATCKAVYVSTASGQIVASMADEKLS